MEAAKPAAAAAATLIDAGVAIRVVPLTLAVVGEDLVRLGEGGKLFGGVFVSGVCVLRFAREREREERQCRGEEKGGGEKSVLKAAPTRTGWYCFAFL